MIRVSSIPEGLRLFEFRRGMKRYSNDDSKLTVNREDTLIIQKEKMSVGGVRVNCGMCESVFLHIFDFCVCLCHQRYVNISSLSFSPDAQFLCASSNTETVHIFKLEQHSPRYWKYSLLSLRLINNWTNESEHLLSLTSLNFVSVCVCVSLAVGRRKLPLGQHM